MYLPVAFHFSVSLDSAFGPSPRGADIDASFQEVSGIRVEFGSESVEEGGENRFVHRLPTAAKYADLVLKRGVVVENSPLAKWVGETLATNLAKPIVPRDIFVTLRNAEHAPLILWTFVKAYPVQWETSAMNAMESAILTETMHFSFHYFERTVYPPPKNEDQDAAGNP